MDKLNLYEVLGVSKDATAEEIKKVKIFQLFPCVIP